MDAVNLIRPEEHMGLVHTIANKYRASQHPIEDLIGEGKIGLMTAAKKFDPARGLAFSTYAGWWIRALIQRFIDQNAQVIYTPIKKVRARRKAGELLPRPASLDAERFNQPDARTLHDVIPDENSPDPEAEAATNEEKQIIWRAVRSLPKRERGVLIQRFVWGKTLDEIGQTLGVTRERVRQIEKKALAALRERLTGDLA